MGFDVLETLKGSVDAHDLHFNGGASRQDDPNDTKVPYSFVRPGGRGGNCFALEYRPGAEYLLFLRAGDVPAYAQQLMLTPYWAPLSPTNEQLLGGADDPWVVWVRARLRENRVPNMALQPTSRAGLKAQAKVRARAARG